MASSERSELWDRWEAGESQRSIARALDRSPATIWFALGFLEARECGEMRVMTTEITPGRPTTLLHSKQEKDQAVRLVFELRNVPGTSQGTVARIGDQLGYGVESLRRWVAQAEVDAGDASDWECRLVSRTRSGRVSLRTGAK
jgi:hypothetical protein